MAAQTPTAPCVGTGGAARLVAGSPAKSQHRQHRVRKATRDARGASAKNGEFMRIPSVRSGSVAVSPGHLTFGRGRPCTTEVRAEIALIWKNNRQFIACTREIRQMQAGRAGGGRGLAVAGTCLSEGPCGSRAEPFSLQFSCGSARGGLPQALRKPYAAGRETGLPEALNQSVSHAKMLCGRLLRQAGVGMQAHMPDNAVH